MGRNGIRLPRRVSTSSSLTYVAKGATFVASSGDTSGEALYPSTSLRNQRGRHFADSQLQQYGQQRIGLGRQRRRAQRIREGTRLAERRAEHR